MDSPSQILRDALSLPSDARADIAAALLASLESAEGENRESAEIAWAREIERRVERLDSGHATLERWEDVRDRIVRRLES